MRAHWIHWRRCGCLIHKGQPDIQYTFMYNVHVHVVHVTYVDGLSWLLLSSFVSFLRENVHTCTYMYIHRTGVPRELLLGNVQIHVHLYVQCINYIYICHIICTYH